MIVGLRTARDRGCFILFSSSISSLPIFASPGNGATFADFGQCHPTQGTVKTRQRCYIVQPPGTHASHDRAVVQLHSQLNVHHFHIFPPPLPSPFLSRKQITRAPIAHPIARNALSNPASPCILRRRADVRQLLLLQCANSDTCSVRYAFFMRSYFLQHRMWRKPQYPDCAVCITSTCKLFIPSAL